MGEKGFGCYYDFNSQHVRDITKYIKDKQFRKDRGPNQYFDLETGFFIRKQEDGRLELIAATSQFLSDLEIQEENYKNFFLNLL